MINPPVRHGEPRPRGDYQYVPLQGPLSAAEQTYLRRLFRQGLLLRLAIALLLEWTGYSESLALDEATYRNGGWMLVRYWMGDIAFLPDHLQWPQVNAYFYLVAASMFVFGWTEIPIKIFNCVIGAAACRYQYFIARELFGESVARRASFFMQFFPSVVLWSTLNIRDTCVIFLILMAAWHSYRIIRVFSVGGLLKVVAAIWLITRFRDYLFMAVSLPIVIAMVVGRRGRFGRNVVVGAVAGVILMLVFEQRSTRHLSLEALSEARQGLASGGSAFHKNVDVSTPGAVLAFLPTALVYFFFSPFPWQITTVLKTMSLPEMLIVYWLTLPTIRGLWSAIRERMRECLVLLLTMGFLTLAYAVGEGNVGTLYRHRAQTVPFYLIFAALGIEKVRRQQQVRSAPMPIGPREAWGR